LKDKEEEGKFVSENINIPLCLSDLIFLPALFIIFFIRKPDPLFPLNEAHP
jgi:hypothetical protein